MLSLLLNPFYRVLAVLGVVFTILASVYGKGRKDASDNARMKSLEENNNAISKANHARSVSASESDRGRLFEDDGFRRN
jgi:cbb3-type cytochrome oxidase subunit 3